MPKVNVYLPDDLAEAVKAAGLPVSAICQRALEQSLKRVIAIKAMTIDDLDTAQLAHFTERARKALRLAVARAAGAGEVGTEHLLHGILAEGDNLALRVLRAMEIEPQLVRNALAPRLSEAKGDPPTRFSDFAANALELTATEAIALGHNYVGCEHLLLGLMSDLSGDAGEVLREVGADLKTMRRTVIAALTGYTHLRAQGGHDSLAETLRKELRPVIERIERLEQRTGLD